MGEMFANDITGKLLGSVGKNLVCEYLHMTTVTILDFKIHLLNGTAYSIHTKFSCKACMRKPRPNPLFHVEQLHQQFNYCCVNFILY